LDRIFEIPSTMYKVPGRASPALGGETVSTLSVEALEASRGLRGPVNKPEKPISAEDNFALAA